MKFTTLDIAIVIAYCIGIIFIATWVSREKSNRKKTTEDYFLASRSLPWWAIGASLIAANIFEREDLYNATVFRETL